MEGGIVIQLNSVKLQRDLILTIQSALMKLGGGTLIVL